MLTLYLCRHAKSSWSDPGHSDIDRPLSDRGLRDAPFMAEVFKRRGERLDLMVSSTANRALTTARIFATGLGAHETQHFDPTQKRPQLTLEPKLYHAGFGTIMSIVNQLPDHAIHVMLFGHNPGFTEAVDLFSGADLDNVPTCGMVRIDFPFAVWKMISRDTGTAVWQDFPGHHVRTA